MSDEYRIEKVIYGDDTIEYYPQIKRTVGGIAGNWSYMYRTKTEKYVFSTPVQCSDFIKRNQVKEISYIAV